LVKLYVDVEYFPTTKQHSSVLMPVEADAAEKHPGGRPWRWWEFCA